MNLTGMVNFQKLVWGNQKAKLPEILVFLFNCWPCAGGGSAAIVLLLFFCLDLPFGKSPI